MKNGLKRRKIFWGLIICLIILAASPADCQAKLLPRFSRTANTLPKTVSSGVIVKPSLRGDRLALNVYFTNLSKAKAVNYTLIYQSEGVDKGVSGSLDLAVGDSTSRELVFGTASSGVYHYDAGIKNMRFEVATELQTGKKTLKKFRVNI